MQRSVRWLTAILFLSLFFSCSGFNDIGGCEEKFLTSEQLAGIEVVPGQAAGVPTWKQLEGTYEMDVFVLMGQWNGNTLSEYEATWDENTGAASYHQNATFIKNPDGKTFKILLSEAQFGMMPVAPVVVFPKVTLTVRQDKTVTLKSLEEGFAGFVLLKNGQSPLTAEDWKDIEKMKKKVELWSKTSSIRPETSEVRLEGGKLVCKIDTNWNLKKETIHAKDEQWKMFAPMFENVKSASATKGKYKGVYDRFKHGAVASGGILEVVPVSTVSGHSITIASLNTVR